MERKISTPAAHLVSSRSRTPSRGGAVGHFSWGCFPVLSGLALLGLAGRSVRTAGMMGGEIRWDRRICWPERSVGSTDH